MNPRTDISLPLVLASSCISACVSPPDDSNDDIAATESDEGEAPPCMDDSAPPINCQYPVHCEVELNQQMIPEGVIVGDLNCAIDAFIDRGSASLSLTYREGADNFSTEVQTIYPVTDEIAISNFDSQQDLSYDHYIERGVIMRSIPYFEDCRNAGDEVAIFLCVWDWKEGCGDTTLTCEE
jgi:hypothetical protein